MKILIVDDDINICNILSIALKHEGYTVTIEPDSIKAKDLIETTPFDLLILDIMMPNLDGFNLCKHARRFTDMPIIFITCLNDEQSLISALSMGGDDYIKKPFTLPEVMMRVKVHLRRLKINSGNQKKQIYKTGDITFYNYKNTVIFDKTKVHLSPLESDILTYFFENPNTAITYKDLYEKIWDEQYLRDKSTIMVRISNLRNKIPGLNITTLRGIGYKFIC